MSVPRSSIAHALVLALVATTTVAGVAGCDRSETKTRTPPADPYAPLDPIEMKAFVDELKTMPGAAPEPAKSAPPAQSTLPTNAPRNPRGAKGAPPKTDATAGAHAKADRAELMRQLRKSPYNADLQARCAFAAWNEANDVDATLRHARAALAIGLPANQLSNVYRLLGAVAEFKEDGPAAERLYTKATETDPKNVEAWYRLGVLANDRGDVALAERQFRRVLGMKTDHVAGLFALGQLLLRKGATAEGEELLARHARVRELDALGYLDDTEAMQCIVLGNRRAVSGDLPQALAEFEHAVEVEPGNLDAASFRGAALLALNRTDEGLAALNEVIAKDGTHGHALTALADWYLLSAPADARDIERGLDFASRAVRATGEQDARALALRARGLEWTGDHTGALESIAKARRLEPKSGAWTTLETQIKDGKLDRTPLSGR